MKVQAAKVPANVDETLVVKTSKGIEAAKQRLLDELVEWYGYNFEGRHHVVWVPVGAWRIANVRKGGRVIGRFAVRVGSRTRWVEES